MSYEPNAHEVQMKILRRLLFSPTAHFSELLRDTELTSDHFNFHIKKLLQTGYVAKSGDVYTLTREGKEYANRMDTDQKVIEKQPKISVLVVVENEDGKFLAQQRLKQPYYGFWGRMSGKVRWGETLEEASARELMEETGLTAELRYAGLYHKMDYQKNGDFLEDKYFIVMYGTNPRGELRDAEGHHNAWLSVDELTAKDKVFASIAEITEFARTCRGGFIEMKYYYDESEY
ncbi:MAG: NUDIX domain-containing protein [Candidatus Saccharimonadales bacterium]